MAVLSDRGQRDTRARLMDHGLNVRWLISHDAARHRAQTVEIIRDERSRSPSQRSRSPSRRRQSAGTIPVRGRNTGTDPGTGVAGFPGVLRVLALLLIL